MIAVGGTFGNEILDTLMEWSPLNYLLFIMMLIFCFGIWPSVSLVFQVKATACWNQESG